MHKNNNKMRFFRTLFLIILLTILLPFSSYGQSAKFGMPDLFLKVNKSVVFIYALERDNSRPGSGHIEKGIGSGVIISEDGLIMTASHVVHIADRVIVKFLDGQTIDAEILSTIPHADVALLKLKKIPNQISVAQLGDSDNVQTGEKIFVVGAPYGIDHTLTVGYVSGRLSGVDMVQNMVSTELIQIDAAVNPGNSGGPVFNMAGQVVGIVSHILSQSGGFEGIGFSVAINTAKSLLLEKDPFWSGVEFHLVSGKMAYALNTPQEAGLLIQRVAYDSSADKSGLKPGTVIAHIDKKRIVLGGDIILEINGLEISKEMAKPSSTTFEALQKVTQEQDKLELKLLREGKIIYIEMIK